MRIFYRGRSEDVTFMITNAPARLLTMLAFLIHREMLSPIG